MCVTGWAQTRTISINDDDSATRAYRLEHVDIELTRKCNLGCIHCSALASRNGSGWVELSLCEIQKILEAAKPLGLKAVGLTGGEPFRQKRKLMKVLNFCQNDIQTPAHIHTNGTLICHEDAEELSRNVSEVTMALYGSKSSTHDFITQKEGSMKSALKGLERLILAGANVSVYTVPMRYNLREIVPLIRRVSKKGVRKMRILSLSPTGRARSKFDKISLTSDEVAWLGEEIGKAQKEIETEVYAGFCTSQSYPKLKMLPGHDSCLAAENRLHVDAFGAVFPCTAASGQSFFVAGNLRDRHYSLAELWQQSPLLQFIRRFHSSPPHKCKKCIKHANCMSGCRVLIANKYGDVTIADPCCKGPLYS